MKAEQNIVISWKRNLFFVWLAQILVMGAFGMVVPFIPIYLRDHLGMADIQNRGVWVAAFYFAGQVGFCFATPAWGMLSDRYGRKIMLLRASLITALLMPLMIFASSALMLVLIRFVVGCFSGVNNAAQTLICDTTPSEKQGFALGTLSSAMWSGNMLGFAVGGFLIDGLGFTWTFLACGGMLLVAGLLILFFVRENFHPVKPDPAQSGSAEEVSDFLHRIRPPSFGVLIWSVLLLFLFGGLVRNFDNPFVALLVETVHGPDDVAKWTAVICGAAAAAGVGSGMLLGYLSDRFSARKILIPVLIGSGLAKLMQGAALSLPMLGTGRVINYFLAGGMDPVFQSMLAKIAPVHKRGSVFGWSASCRTVGSIIGSVFGGYVVYYLGVRWIFYIAGMIFFVLLPVFLAITSRRVTEAGRSVRTVSLSPRRRRGSESR